MSIAKGGVMCKLSARCSIVCAANPISGHYDSNQTMSQNIRSSNAILSRFDMVHLLHDTPDMKQDKHLSEHVMKLHNRRANRDFGDIFDTSSVMS